MKVVVKKKKKRRQKEAKKDILEFAEVLEFKVVEMKLRGTIFKNKQGRTGQRKL